MQCRIADMATRIEAARLLVYHAARLSDTGQPLSKEPAMAKLCASETAMERRPRRRPDVRRLRLLARVPGRALFRDAKITEIYEGTSEIQRLVIARDLWGEAARG